MRRYNDKLTDPAHEDFRLQPERDGRVRWSGWFGVPGLWIIERAKREARIRNQGPVELVVDRITLLPRLLAKTHTG